jgi:hypothetical protein
LNLYAFSLDFALALVLALSFDFGTARVKINAAYPAIVFNRIFPNGSKAGFSQYSEKVRII